jgi:hypothetical protein
MPPQARSAQHGGVTVLANMLCEGVFVSKDAYLFESIHAFSNFNVDPTAGSGDWVEIELLNNLVGDEAQWEAHLLVVSSGSVQATIFDASDHELGSWGGDGAIDEALGGLRWLC